MRAPPPHSHRRHGHGHMWGTPHLSPGRGTHWWHRSQCYQQQVSFSWPWAFGPVCRPSRVFGCGCWAPASEGIGSTSNLLNQSHDTIHVHGEKRHLQSALSKSKTPCWTCYASTVAVAALNLDTGTPSKHQPRDGMLSGAASIAPCRPRPAAPAAATATCATACREGSTWLAGQQSWRPARHRPTGPWRHRSAGHRDGSPAALAPGRRAPAPTALCRPASRSPTQRLALPAIRRAQTVAAKAGGRQPAFKQFIRQQPGWQAAARPLLHIQPGRRRARPPARCPGGSLQARH